jgi:LPPG:FO 2-phospho-L-lactate transferase
MITALCGGVGGSKLVLGLYRVSPPDSLSVIVNTADDLEFCGLHVSPDLDTVTYTLGGIARHDVGWGIEGDTFEALQMLGRYGVPTWFQVGDRDLATHTYRTNALRNGQRLTEVTQHLVSSLDVQAKLLPMSDDPVATQLLAKGEWLDFQDYFVRRRYRDPVEAVRHQCIERARPTEETLTAIAGAETIVLVNSNPVLSILPLLSLPGLREALLASRAPRVAVSPIIGLDAVTGPAGHLMHVIGRPPSAIGVAETYVDVIDGIVIDRADEAQVPRLEELGLRVLCTNILMPDDAARERLAAETLAFARTVR